MKTRVDGGNGLRATFEGKSLEGVAAQEGIMEGRRIVTTVTPSHLPVLGIERFGVRLRIGLQDILRQI
jgi:hypothetical protein